MDYSNLPYWLRQLLADLERHEGFREFAYPDPLSPLFKRHPKEKWGYMPAEIILMKLGADPKDGAPWTVGFGFTNGVTYRTKMSRSLAQEKLLPVVLKHCNELYKLLPKWDGYPDYVKTVLGNLIYNLGLSRLGQFKNTLKLFKAEKWKEAGEGLKHSLWYKQTGDRSKELVERMKTGRVAPEHKVK